MYTNIQNEIAIQCLEKLEIYRPYINKFKTSGMPCFFENYAGFWVDQEPDVYKKMKEIEEENNVLVYAMTHELTDYGETWAMLCVTADTDIIEDVLGRFNNTEFYALSYVWNKSNPIFSEFGDSIIKSSYGGIKRVH